MKLFNLLCVFTLAAGVFAEPCVKDSVDIGFMVDTSYTGSLNYAANLRTFIQNSVERFYTGDQYLKVGFFKYGVIESSAFTTNVGSAIVSFSPSSTQFNLLGAIQSGMDKFSQSNGARLVSSKILVVVTGATLTNSFSSLDLLSLQSQRSITVIVVGVGHPVYGVGLTSIAHKDGVVVLGTSDNLATSQALATKFSVMFPCGYCSSSTVCNGGSCAKGLCDCPSGLEGHYCSSLQPIGNECNLKPCISPCTCVPSCRHEGGYYCVGPDGKLGKNCNIQPPQLSCHGSSISVSIPQEFVRDQASPGNQMYMYMSPHEIPYSSTGDKSCQVTTLSSGSFYSLSVPVPFTACGTIKGQSPEGVVSFSNVVWLNHYDPVHDMPVPVIQFTCYYNGSYQVLSAIQPVVDDVRVDLQDDISTGTASIEFCKIAGTCLSACPPMYTVTGGAVYTVAQYINLRMTVHNEQQQGVNTSMLHAVVVAMFLTCHGDDSDTNQISVIADGCPAIGFPSRIHFNGKSDSVCISFKVPRISDCMGIFYIHAKLVQMHVDDIRNLKACTGVHNRKMRSVILDGPRIPSNKTQSISLHNIGPIYYLDEKEGRGETKMFPDSDVIIVPGTAKVSQPLPAYHSALVTACIILSVFATLLLCSALFWKVRYSK